MVEMAFDVTLRGLLVNFILGSIILVRGFLILNYDKFNVKFAKKFYESITIVNTNEYKDKLTRSFGHLFIFFGLFMFFLPVYLKYFSYVSPYAALAVPIIAAIVFYGHLLRLKKEDRLKINL